MNQPQSEPPMNSSQLAQYVLKLCEDNGFHLRELSFGDRYGVHSYKTHVAVNMSGSAKAQFTITSP